MKKQILDGKNDSRAAKRTLDDVKKPKHPEPPPVQALDMTEGYRRHSRTKMTNWRRHEQRGPERRMSNQIHQAASFELIRRLVALVFLKKGG